MSQAVHLAWHGPFSLFVGEGVPCVFEDALANRSYGVYLWTIEHGNSHLVNYVGKTYGGNSDRTFAKRFAEELDYEMGKGICVDVDLFFTCIRKVVPWHHERIDDVLKAYRIFIAPLPDLGDPAFLQIEGSLINGLYDAGEEYGQFVANPRCRRSYPGPISMDRADVLGFEAFVDRPASDESTARSREPVSTQHNPNDMNALRAIQWFFSVPWSEHGVKRTYGDREGWYEHDWGDLVQRISRADYGHEQDMPAAWEIGNTFRKICRSKKAWDHLASDPESQRQVLAIVRSALSAIEGDAAPKP